MCRFSVFLLALIGTACCYQDRNFNSGRYYLDKYLRNISMPLADNDLEIRTDTIAVSRDGEVSDITNGFRIAEGTHCVISSGSDSRDTITVNFGSNWCEDAYGDIMVNFAVVSGDSTVWSPVAIIGTKGILDKSKHYRFVYRERKKLPRKIKIYGKQSFEAE